MNASENSRIERSAHDGATSSRQGRKFQWIFTALVFFLGASTDGVNGQVSAQSAEVGAAGGVVGSYLYEAETLTGGAVAGGVSSISSPRGVVAKLGYTGQLYDVKTLAVTASPGVDVAEGDATQLAALMTMDDETTLTTRDVRWSVISGPATIDGVGLLVARPVIANATVTAEGNRGEVSGSLDLTIINLPYQASPLIWTDPQQGGSAPYRIWMGRTPESLTEVGLSNLTHFNPGILDMGVNYYFRVFDASGNDITPGGNGADPISFKTSSFQPDLRIGTKISPTAHRGNNVYNLSGSGQSASITITGGRPGSLHFTVENDGDSPDGHLLRASKASKKLGTVSYFEIFRGRANVTAMVTRGGHSRSNLDPAVSAAYQVQAKSRGKKRAAQSLRIWATSLSDFRGADAAIGFVKAVNHVK